MSSNSINILASTSTLKLLLSPRPNLMPSLSRETASATKFHQKFWCDQLWPSSKTNHALSTVESRRSKRTKADDPQKDESRRSGAKADDLWVKADDPGRKQTIFGSKQTIFWAKADDLWVKADDPGQSGRSRGLKADDPMDQSRRPFLNYNYVKTDDLKGWKQTIHFTQTLISP